jgi:hypothetical protein
MKILDFITAPSVLTWFARRLFSSSHAVIVVPDANLLGWAIVIMRKAGIKTWNYIIIDSSLHFCVPAQQEGRARDALNRSGIENE